MAKYEALKHLQNLYSWYELYTKLGTYNPDAADKVKEQIEEHKKKYSLH